MLRSVIIYAKSENKITSMLSKTDSDKEVFSNVCEKNSDRKTSETDG